MKVASLSVLPPVLPRANRRRKAIGSGATGIGFGQNTNEVKKTSKFNVLG